MFKHITIVDKDPTAPEHTRNPFETKVRPPKPKPEIRPQEKVEAAPKPKKKTVSAAWKSSENLRWILIVAGVLALGGAWYVWSSGAPERQVASEYKAAIEMLESGRFQAARVGIDTLLTHYPQSRWADDALWQFGLAATASGEIVLARNTFQRLVEGYPESPYIERSLEQLQALANIKVEPRETLRFAEPIEVREYTVRPGDTLGGIAKRFGTTVTALSKANRLEDSMIFPDQVLRIVPPLD